MNERKLSLVCICKVDIRSFIFSHGAIKNAMSYQSKYMQSYHFILKILKIRPSRALFKLIFYSFEQHLEDHFQVSSTKYGRTDSQSLKTEIKDG